ncbi:hypothetical protein ACSFBM_15530 [Variovorax sp. GB1R11]|uniref:hypothetical protein n=1 Tax=Variovorax sp. GB1R11 TaxID=3443741 RepID=UPI003F479575
MVAEFISAYSDDQIYIEMLENLVNSHPVEAHAPDSVKYSSFARLWAVMMVGAVECMIKEWAKNRPNLQDIYAYFEKGPNEGRIHRLEAAFKSRGLHVDSNCFQDYLAIKYIRNAYVHGEWSEPQRSFVESRGFPGSVMLFNQADYERMKDSYKHVMNNLGMASVADGLLPQKQ